MFTSDEVLINCSTQRPSILGQIQEVRQHWHLLRNLVLRDLTVRYKRSVIGFFWTMLNPLILMIIFTIVFSTIFKFNIDHYAVYFLSEYLVFMFFSQSTVTAMVSLGWNGSLMKKVRVPKSIFAISTVLSGLVNLCLAYIPLFIIMLVVGAPIRPAVLFLPVAFIIIAAFTLGVSFFLSSLAVYFDDVSHMYQVGTMAWLYLTPVIYPITIIPARWVWLIRINPLTHLFKLARDPIYLGQLPAVHIVVPSVIISVVTLWAGWTVFNRLSRGFYLHL